MDLETLQFPSFGFSKYFPEIVSPKCISEEQPEDLIYKTEVLESVIRDDKEQVVTLSKLYNLTIDKSIASELLHLCCIFDSVKIATSVLNGELGEIPLLNSTNDDGKSPLHTAAIEHSARCLELLLRKRARTDIRTKDKNALLPLELCLSSWRMDVIWKPDLHSVGDLIVVLGEKDLTATKLLSDKTSAVGDVAYASAIRGHIVELAALLIVAAQRVNDSILVLHNAGSGAKEETTVYESLIREALALGCPSTTSTLLVSLKRNCSSTKEENEGKRKLLLCEIELLQLFGAVGCIDKKVAPILILAVQAGDVDVTEQLLKTSINVNEADAEGNSALHWSIKTSKASPIPHKRILLLLLKRGAIVNQKNKLGLTAVHIAAENGNTEALQALLLEDPSCLNYRTVMKETPLFFAVKNDRIESAELLLRLGAERQVLNMRRQRPIDLAVSQDMRFILSPANIIHLNHASQIQKKCKALQPSDGVNSESYEKLITAVVENSNRIFSSTKMEGPCKGCGSRSGCFKEDKCIFIHGEQELKQKRIGYIHDPTATKIQRKIFVGGLPQSLDSDSLRKHFEEQFGPVDEAFTIGCEMRHRSPSRGFGFVVFKDKNSTLAATEAHYITIGGKQVEIKSAVPKSLLDAYMQKLSPGCSPIPPEEPTKGSTSTPPEKPTNESTPKILSWVDVVHIEPKPSSKESQPVINSSVDVRGGTTPTWFRTFKKWLPGFLLKVSKREGNYALSSLKIDFNKECGLELNHDSLGYSKLSDLMKTLPTLCRIKYISTGKCGSVNHMIILPNIQQPLPQPFRKGPSLFSTKPVDDSKACDTISTVSQQDRSLISNENTNMEVPKENPAQKISSPSMPPSFLHLLPHSLTKLSSTSSSNATDDDSSKDCGSSKSVNQQSTSLIFNGKVVLEVPIEKPAQKIMSTSIPSLFRQLMEPDPMFHARKWLHNESTKPVHHCSHLVLEALVRKKHNSSFFSREFDFYKMYKESIVLGQCFGCNQKKILWANFPCQHLLWCDDCKLKAISASGLYEHKCVICDKKVEKIDLPRTWYGKNRQSVCGDIDEFLTLDPNRLEKVRT